MASSPLRQLRTARGRTVGAEVQIQVLLNISCTNTTATGLTGKFYARAIFYAADIASMQYRVDLKMSPH